MVVKYACAVLVFVAFAARFILAEEWEPLGCYKDASDRTMRDIFHTISNIPSKPNYKAMFEECRLIAEKKGYTYFGIQNTKECWGAKDARKTYMKYGCENNCFPRQSGYGIGAKWSNFVYRQKIDWTECSAKKCGDGVQHKLVLLKDTGAECPSYNLKVHISSKTRKCSAAKPCPVDGGWSEYSKWSDCTKTCGSGTQTRTRTCTNPKPLNGGKACVGEARESRACNTKKCPTCKVRTTNGKCCVFPFIYGGKSYDACIVYWCATTPNYDKDSQWGNCILDGGWSKYSEWSDCTKTCGSGTQTRTRTCTKPKPLNGGKACVGEAKETRACNTKKCPPCKVRTTNGKCCVFPFIYGGKSYDACIVYWCATTPNYDKDGQWGNCILDGGWSEYSEWSDCTKTCGSGTQTRTRTCTKPKPLNGGKACVGEAKETRACNTKKCPPCKVHTTNGKCCVFPFIYGGKSYDACIVYWCATTPNYDKDSQWGNCILDGGWSEYSKWSDCTKTCGSGTQTRTRTCTNPKPLNGGKVCVGEAKETRACNTKKCPPCKVRTTNGKCCVFPFIYGGKSYDACIVYWCATTPNYDKDSQWGNCILDGGWSEYSEWSDCTKTCGNGIQTRTRTCTNPKPLNGGKACVGEAKKTRACNTKKCPPCKVHTTNGKCCVFPFIYGGKSYDACLNGWCATTPNYDKDSQWGNCA